LTDGRGLIQRDRQRRTPHLLDPARAQILGFAEI
jgi:hypothetical protein